LCSVGKMNYEVIRKASDKILGVVYDYLRGLGVELAFVDVDAALGKHIEEVLEEVYRAGLEVCQEGLVSGEFSEAVCEGRFEGLVRGLYELFVRSGGNDVEVDVGGERVRLVPRCAKVLVNRVPLMVYRFPLGSRGVSVIYVRFFVFAGDVRADVVVSGSKVSVFPPRYREEVMRILSALEGVLGKETRS